MNGSAGPMTVGEFTARMKRLFGRVPAFREIAIEGDISEWKIASGGYANFTLKDSESTATLRCFAWPADVRTFPPGIGEGLRVVARGSVDIWGPRSQYQLVVRHLVPSGTGALHLERERLKRRLQQEGVFDRPRKPIPLLPRRVALVTSPDARALTDVLSQLDRHRVGVHVIVVQTRVQGEGAEEEIAAAIRRAGKLGVDLIGVVRGGGSFEELFCFNREAVVRAIIESPVPVVTGIGHVEDQHLADAVADEDRHTPSRVGELIAELWERQRRDLSQHERALVRAFGQIIVMNADELESRRGRLDRAADGIIARLREAVLRLGAGLERNRPEAQLARRMHALADLRARLEVVPQRTIEGRTADLRMALARLDAAADRLCDGYRHDLDRVDERMASLALRLTDGYRHRLEQAWIALRSLDPDAPLRRGYAVVTVGERLLLDASDAPVGTLVRARLARGTLRARVEGHGDDE
jgi:exodeoxyribonuclease VII large subunit